MLLLFIYLFIYLFCFFFWGGGGVGGGVGRISFLPSIILEIFKLYLFGQNYRILYCVTSLGIFVQI